MSLRLVRYEYDDPYVGHRYGAIAADRVVYEDDVTGEIAVVHRNKDSDTVTDEDLPPLLRRYGIDPLEAARDYDPRRFIGR